MHPLERLILSALLVAPRTRRLTVRESLARLAVSYYAQHREGRIGAYETKS